MMLQFIISSIVFAEICPDTVGIYFTKEQFTKSDLQLKSFYWIKAKGPIFWSDFSFEAKGAIKIKINKKNKRTFELQTIYGFKKEGIKFMFVNPLNEYLAILYESPFINIFVKENVYLLYHKSKRVTFLYEKNIGDSLKKFNKQNILADFSNDLILQKKLFDLSAQLKREETYFPYKHFFKWQKKTEDYLK
ncbi:MAG TPA: hypothetical protein VIJ95_09090 [Hanamia sp.]